MPRLLHHLDNSELFHSALLAEVFYNYGVTDFEPLSHFRRDCARKREDVRRCPDAAFHKCRRLARERPNWGQA
eukprot:10797156-Alexandrium_andersonii.AAC.1